MGFEFGSDGLTIGDGTSIRYQQFSGLIRAFYRMCPDTQSCEDTGKGLASQHASGNIWSQDLFRAFVKDVCIWRGDELRPLREQVWPLVASAWHWETVHSAFSESLSRSSHRRCSSTYRR